MICKSLMADGTCGEIEQVCEDWLIWDQYDREDEEAEWYCENLPEEEKEVR